MKGDAPGPSKFFPFWGGLGGGVANQFLLTFDHGGSGFVGSGDMRSRWNALFPGKISLFSMWRLIAQPAASSATYVVRKNGVDSAITVTFGVGELMKQDAVNEIDVAAGDQLEIRQSAVTGTPAATNIQAQVFYSLA